MAPVSFFSIMEIKSTVSRVDDATASSRAATSTTKLISGAGAGAAAASVRRPAMMMEIFMVVMIWRRQTFGRVLRMIYYWRGSEFLMGRDI